MQQHRSGPWRGHLQTAGLRNVVLPPPFRFNSQGGTPIERPARKETGRRCSGSGLSGRSDIGHHRDRSDDSGHAIVERLAAAIAELPLAAAIDYGSAHTRQASRAPRARTSTPAYPYRSFRFWRGNGMRVCGRRTRTAGERDIGMRVRYARMGSQLPRLDPCRRTVVAGNEASTATHRHHDRRARRVGSDARPFGCSGISLRGTNRPARNISRCAF